MPGFLASVSSEAGITEQQTQLAISAALRRLHRIATVDQLRLSAVLVEVYLEIGPEACWHLGGLLEVQRTHHDPDVSKSEILMRLDRRLRHYDVLIEKWLKSANTDGDSRGEDR